MIPESYTVCMECGKTISMDEYVVNFGSCSNCLDSNFCWYMAVEAADAEGFSGHA